jgi:hypothetical protein
MALALLVPISGPKKVSIFRAHPSNGRRGPVVAEEIAQTLMTYRKPANIDQPNTALYIIQANLVFARNAKKFKY